MHASDDALALATDVLARVQRHDGDADVQVTVHAERSGLTRFANSTIHQHVGEATSQLEILVARGGRVASTSVTASADPGRVDAAIDAVLDAASLRPVDPQWSGVAGPSQPSRGDHVDDATEEATPDTRAAIVSDFVGAGRGLSAAGFVDTALHTTAIATSAGQAIAGRSTRATLDGIHQSATSAGSAHHTSFAVTDLDGVAEGERAARLARESERTVDLDPGDYEIVASPDVVAEAVAWLAFYGFNAKAVQDGRSFVRVGEQQFDTAFDLLDDATDPRSIGLGFDAEGTPTPPLPLVIDGTSRALAHDRRTAAQAGASSTGHAIGQGALWGAVPSSLFIRPGDLSPDELIANVERGLFIANFNYVRVLDQKTVECTGLTRNGTFLIEDGRIVGAVANLRFTESFVSALGPGRVLGVGNDARFGAGEIGNGMVHTPSLHLARWHFTGNARG